jgi:hypothetical protein
MPTLSNPHRSARVRRHRRPPCQSLGSAGVGSPGSERTCKDEARGLPDPAVPPARDKTGRRLPGLIHDLRLTVIEGGPHAIPWTHADQVNTALLGFIRS